MKRYDEDNIIKIIQAAVVLSNQKQVSKNLGVSPQYLSDVLKRRRPIADRLLNALGFRRVSYFVEVKS